MQKWDVVVFFCATFSICSKRCEEDSSVPFDVCKPERKKCTENKLKCFLLGKHKEPQNLECCQ